MKRIADFNLCKYDFRRAVRSTVIHFRRIKNIPLNNYKKTFLFIRAYWKKHIPGYTGTPAKTAWIIILAEARTKLKDSMNETDFRKILSSVTSKIGCGHTSIRSSKAYDKYRDTSRIIRIFPLSLKLWDDTAVVVANLNRKDSILNRGTMIKKINEQTISADH